MENCEAIEILRGCVVSEERENGKPNGNITCDLTREVLNMAISALEKQEGKGPVAVNAKSTWVKCPVCGSTDIDEYCEKCGQRIDWSDEHGAD